MLGECLVEAKKLVITTLKSRGFSIVFWRCLIAAEPGRLVEAEGKICAAKTS